MVKFSESGLKVSEKRAKLEFNSDIIVVKGRKMGKVRVTTQVIEDKYKSK
jgi:nuclear pore complex protein Nup210